MFQPAFEVRNTGTRKGRGVFALKNFRKNQVIEVCPALVIEDYFSLVPDCIQNVVFDGSGLADLSAEGKKANKEVLAIVLGYGSLYNHASPSNVVVVDDRQRSALVFKARCSIREGEELLINYDDLSGGVDSSGKWLGSRNVEIE